MIYLMSGIIGSGKSTYIKHHAAPFDVVISRDKIRYSLLQDGEDYFAHEKEVIKKFKEYIRLSDENTEWGNIWIDATNITKKTRRRLLNYISHNDVTCVYFKPDIEKAIEHNNKRTGREKAPEREIIRQATMYEEPSFEEGFKYIVEVRNE